jgi:hypothetical protein
MSPDELRDFLDLAITNWRGAKKQAQDEMKVKMTASCERDLLMSECYIDAFQCVRSAYFEELLPQ